MPFPWLAAPRLTPFHGLGNIANYSFHSRRYIFPLTMRTRMAELFKDEACIRWWLPNDEGFSPVLKSVRALADERNATLVSAQTENLREIRHVFSKMQLGGGADDGSQTRESDHGSTSSGKDKGKGKGKDVMG